MAASRWWGDGVCTPISEFLGSIFCPYREVDASTPYGVLDPGLSLSKNARVSVSHPVVASSGSLVQMSRALVVGLRPPECPLRLQVHSKL